MSRIQRRILPRLAFIWSLAALVGCSVETTPLAGIRSAGSRANAARAASSDELASVGWQARGRALVINHNQSPMTAVRTLALLGVAQYGAVVDADNEFDDRGRSNFEAQRGAIAGASTQVLSFIFPDAAAALEQGLVDEANARAGETHPHFTRGVAIGRAWGDVLIAWAKNDGFTKPWTGTIPVGPQYWRSAPNVPPAGPQIGAMRPYFMSSPAEFHPLPPPEFNSAAHLADLAEVVNISNTRTAQQLATAVFWNLPPGTTATAIGYWDEQAALYIAEQGLSERESAHVFALANAAMMDAVIGCWEAKYTYFFIRPYQANTSITTPIGQPNHPSYPSGHSCVSSTAADVLSSFFPSHSETLHAGMAEAGLSRIYGGIHYRFDITAGQTLGKSVAQKALAYDRAHGLLDAVR